ncbi:hypothetical protein ES703_30301 [subsurface metagenome]
MIGKVFKCLRYRKHRLAALYLLCGRDDKAVLEKLKVIQ